MASRSSTIALACILLLGFGGAPSPACSAASPPHPVLTALSDGHAFSIDDANGRYLAIHFLPACDTAAAVFVRDYLRSAPAVAGVTHAFVPADPADKAAAWRTQFGDDAAMIFIDKDGALATDLGLHAGPSAPLAPPASVIFDPDGKELFRTVGAAPDDYPPFDRFARELAEKSKPPALSDYNLPKGKAPAVDGYDVVAYFTKARALQGKPEITSAYRGITYRFATDEDRRLFAVDPKKYLPTYGGWCATAMGDKGTKVEIDPTSFKVKDGRLFLFYKGLFSDAIKDWNKHEAEWEPAADTNWKKLTREDPAKPPK